MNPFIGFGVICALIAMSTENGHGAFIGVAFVSGLLGIIVDLALKGKQ
jgi:flagellar motor component MotA